MRIGFSLFLLVLGAILRYAVTFRPETVDLQVTGLILMIAGGLGLVLSSLFALLGQRRGQQRPQEGA